MNLVQRILSTLTRAHNARARGREEEERVTPVRGNAPGEIFEFC